MNQERLCNVLSTTAGGEKKKKLIASIAMPLLFPLFCLIFLFFFPIYIALFPSSQGNLFPQEVVRKKKSSNLHNSEKWKPILSKC